MSLGQPVFTKINEGFTCRSCGHAVPPASGTCRDHCPKCLFSLHVDVNPGDRAADCGGILRPVSYAQHKKKGIMIHYQCDTCGAKRVNKFLDHDAAEADAFDALLGLSGKTQTG